ncbi:PLDc N-terminal domain-containing protein [Roseinatronobacter sp.]|uniref:PLDc N-terminal domain-containing protein n=1 Tax=Roseinatronobacter sp. TaxID=1945755 RepID=UPI0025F550F4|nr:PLDc N-terminal domain-containing protein [Rhodobaca sp.]
MNANFSGFLGLIHLALVVWAAVAILGSSATQGQKVLWILLVLLFPVVGLIIWFIAGPKKT